MCPGLGYASNMNRMWLAAIPVCNPQLASHEQVIWLAWLAYLAKSRITCKSPCDSHFHQESHCSSYFGPCESQIWDSYQSRILRCMRSIWISWYEIHAIQMYSQNCDSCEFYESHELLVISLAIQVIWVSWLAKLSVMRLIRITWLTKFESCDSYESLRYESQHCEYRFAASHKNGRSLVWDKEKSKYMPRWTLRKLSFPHSTDFNDTVVGRLDLLSVGNLTKNWTCYIGNVKLGLRVVK